MAEFLLELYSEEIPPQLQIAARSQIKQLVEKKIIVKSMYMFGNPDDDINSIKTTIEYSKYLPNQLVQCSVFTPYPGTPIYKTFENKITEKKYEYFNQYNLVFKHNTLDNNNLVELKNLGYRSFYFNLGKIFIIFKSLFSLVRS